FFSSRRRHTRSDRDWSSDVCSSDLDLIGCTEANGMRLLSLDVFHLHGNRLCRPPSSIQQQFKIHTRRPFSGFLITIWRRSFHLFVSRPQSRGEPKKEE